jgi:hypothetical protein
VELLKDSFGIGGVAKLKVTDELDDGPALANAFLVFLKKPNLLDKALPVYVSKMRCSQQVQLTLVLD